MFSKKKKNKNELLSELAYSFSAKTIKQISVLSDKKLINLCEKAKKMITEKALSGERCCKICETGSITTQDFPIIFNKEDKDWISCYLKYFLDNGFNIDIRTYKYYNKNNELCKATTSRSGKIEENNLNNIQLEVDRILNSLDYEKSNREDCSVEYQVEFFAFW